MKSPRFAIAAALFAAALSFVGCIHHESRDALMQQMDDTPTTNPYYWLDQPSVAQIQDADFERLWRACERTARDYLFTLDRENYRTGLLTTLPLVSRQEFEPWRPDTGTDKQVWESTICTIRRTLRFQVTRANDGSYIAIPKVLVERQTILERRTTDVDQYHEAFSGPTAVSSESITSDEPADIVIPNKYWTPIRRDTEMEKQVAVHVNTVLSSPAPAR